MIFARRANPEKQKFLYQNLILEIDFTGHILEQRKFPLKRSVPSMKVTDELAMEKF